MRNDRDKSCDHVCRSLPRGPLGCPPLPTTCCASVPPRPRECSHRWASICDADPEQQASSRSRSGSGARRRQRCGLLCRGWRGVPGRRQRGKRHRRDSYPICSTTCTECCRCVPNTQSCTLFSQVMVQDCRVACRQARHRKPSCSTHLILPARLPACLPARSFGGARRHGNCWAESSVWKRGHRSLVLCPHTPQQRRRRHHQPPAAGTGHHAPCACAFRTCRTAAAARVRDHSAEQHRQGERQPFGGAARRLPELLLQRLRAGHTMPGLDF